MEQDEETNVQELIRLQKGNFRLKILILVVILAGLILIASKQSVSPCSACRISVTSYGNTQELSCQNIIDRFVKPIFAPEQPTEINWSNVSLRD